MTTIQLLLLAGGGLFSGILAGFLGIGGGTVLVPLLVTLGYTPVESVATSSLAILMTSLSGSIQNWRMGFFRFKQVFYIGLPAIFTAQLGASLANWVPDYILLVTFGLLLWLNIYLVQLRKQITQDVEAARHESSNPLLARLFTGGAAGFLAGFFGVGGGVIMVPLQILLLGETIKTAIQTSLGVIVITAVSACVGHAWRGNVLLLEGLLLGIGGLIGAQVSTRFLPKLPDRTVTIAFRTLLGLLSIYIFVQAWVSYHG
ncbi:sulfite exporter TauE/SafE family protein [Desertifilum sp. FACHB-1129]|uniref:Probable membrane transporter protein n=1 Tax=Desertifilum tharense IPPAS B-1220 TaxID=1781255 RepID=A0A1E5QP95_9CYAN|nr:MULTISPECIES: sulfite exporter TauE/SafE family protein [Desertifilum]MDA0211065.1 sulfite exporter TauE/SafE family protein [Cyanobacteria bacterium FC1]MBD2312683.1 sulfite exporter TauE/SafE family protein [Desertifilum sp. FACHB-1129]MBD2320164.1 sulfite exporter TauE/SafE family protein [Desertifilum sp. FACHB-866]MBD2330292.1 sulfite exporter TauE/SafE family protein [Desertifilum sp. FACHB-868]OEJ76480.1 permease [Desertifilum tharense IPPAS B-1220]